MTKSTIDYPFTATEAEVAFEEHGFNCGPAALAFALGLKPNAALEAIPGFATKAYTTPGMMREALDNLHCRWEEESPVGCTCPTDAMFYSPSPSIVRVQFSGPWTKPGANPRWAYRHTHWLASWRDLDGVRWVFDLNCGIVTYAQWMAETVPAITATIPRADGGWFPTHVFQIERQVTT